MKKNKSIDGLVIRDSVKSPAPHQLKRKTTVSHKAQDMTKKPVISTTKVRRPATTKPSVALKTIKKTTQPAKQQVEDFLKPVQVFDFDEKSSKLSPSSKKSKPTAKAPDSKKAKKLKKQKTKKKMSKKRRIIISILLTIFILLAGLICWLIFWGNDIIAKITGGQGNIFDLIHWVDDKYEPLKTDANGRTNILAFGTSGYNMEGDEGNGVHAGAQLTDSIMMISINQETGDVAMLSLPRDLKASPTCTATGKINEVYWCNNMNGDDETAGATALMAEVGSILGVDFQYYAHLNWGSLVTIVDILGGINITLDEDILDYNWTGAVFEAGQTYTIDGAQALGLARARHGTTSGDFSRGASQQKILIGIKDKILEKNLSITNLIDLASSLGDNLRTNFSLDEIKTVAHLASSFDFDNMRQISLVDPANNIYYFTTGPINGISYVFPSAGIGNYGAIQAYVAENLSNDPRIRENPSIIILNATDEAGLAAAESDKLTEAGYNIDAIDNTPDGTEFNDTYTIYLNGDNYSGTKAMLEEYYNVTVKPISEAPDSITRDYSFVIILGPTPTEDN